MTGPAFDRLIAALGKAGRQPRIHGSGRATAHCPGPGHYRDDQHPSLVIDHGDDCALVYCFALCQTEDVLGAIGLTLADLFDEPRQRPACPSRNQLNTAIGRARGLDATDRYLYMRLIWRMEWDGSGIPLRFQPRTQRDLADTCGLGRMTIQQSTAHLAFHGWLSLTCAAPDCKRDLPHAGRGHRAVYGFPGIGEDCPGRKCRSRSRPEKAARAANLRLVVCVGAAALISLGSVAGGASFPPTTYLQQKPAADLRLHVQSAAIYHPQVQPFTAGTS